MMGEVTDLAGQHEVIAEDLTSEVIKEITCLVKDFKEERKKCLQEGAKCMASLSSQLSSLERAKKNYEKAFKEAERASENYKRADEDFSLSRAEVAKQMTNKTIKLQYCEESKTEYANQLQRTNELQHQHYYVLMPDIFRQLQELDEKRIRCFRNFMSHSAEVERKVFPIINQCLDGIVAASNEVNEKEDTLTVIERYKSGFVPPEDIPFEDLSLESDTNTMNSSVSKNPSLNSHMNHTRIRPDRTIKGTMSVKNKKRSAILGIFSSNKNNIPSLYGDHKDDFNELPPNQRKKKLQHKVEEIQAKIQQETATRDGLMKMKGVYEQNPALGDPMSIEGQLNASSHRLDKLKTEIQKYQVLLEDVEKNSPAGVRKISYPPGTTNGVQHNGSHDVSVTDGRRNSCIRDEGSLSRSASDSSMTQQQQQQQPTKLNHSQISPNATMLPNHHGYSNSPESGISTSHTSLPDADFPEYYDPPALGTCRALYPFEATSEGSIPMHDGEELLIIELDQGDGWTRVRRQHDHEEGFVPTSYIECSVYNC